MADIHRPQSSPQIHFICEHHLRSLRVFQLLSFLSNSEISGHGRRAQRWWHWGKCARRKRCRGVSPTRSTEQPCSFISEYWYPTLRCWQNFSWNVSNALADRGNGGQGLPTLNSLPSRDVFFVSCTREAPLLAAKPLLATMSQFRQSIYLFCYKYLNWLLVKSFLFFVVDSGILWRRGGDTTCGFNQDADRTSAENVFEAMISPFLNVPMC